MRLQYLQILLTDLSLFIRSNKDISLLSGLKIGVVFSNQGAVTTVMLDRWLTTNFLTRVKIMNKTDSFNMHINHDKGMHIHTCHNSNMFSFATNCLQFHSTGVSHFQL